MANKAIKIGIIGCGGIATQHQRGYQACENVEIAAGADVDLKKAVAMVGEDHAYASYDEMFKKVKLDAVSVCTPPKFHKDAVCAALNAGVNVLCEKPLAMNETESKEMVDCAKKNGKLLVTAFCHRFHEPVMIAKELIDSGKIGKPTMFRNRFGGLADMTQVWFSNPVISGGGTVLDTSIHSIDLFRYLMGNPSKVAGATKTADSRYKVEDCSLVLLQTADGVIGSIEASWTSPGSANIIEIYGTEGAIMIDYCKPGVRFIKSGSNDWEEQQCSKPDRFILQAQHFVNCVSTGAKPIVDGEDGRWAMAITDAAYGFAKGNGWINVK